MVNPGQSREDALGASARALRTLLPIAREAGLVLSIEPHVHSYLESPAITLELLREVEGLNLTLDYSHFMCLGFRAGRDRPPPAICGAHPPEASPPRALQTAMGQGTLNIGALLGALKKQGYAGYIALEAVHQEYMNTVYEDVLSEIILMRDFCREYLCQTASRQKTASKF